MIYIENNFFLLTSKINYANAYIRDEYMNICVIFT